jgi:hypothetical protein
MKPFRSYGADAGVGFAAYTTIALAADAVNDAGSKGFPDEGQPGLLTLSATNAAGVTHLDFYLSEDAAGLYAISPVTRWTLVPAAGPSTAGKPAGSFVQAYDLSKVPWQRSSFGAIGAAHLQIRTDAATADVEAILRGLEK